MKDYVLGFIDDPGVTLEANNDEDAREKARDLFGDRGFVLAPADHDAGSRAEAFRRAVAETVDTDDDTDDDDESADESGGDSSRPLADRKVSPDTSCHALLSIMDAFGRPVTNKECLDAYNAYGYSASSTSGAMSVLKEHRYVAVMDGSPYRYGLIYEGKRFLREHGRMKPPKNATLPSEAKQDPAEAEEAADA